ncbi:hypothetical protein EP7_005674 (plasmid) [Isosphaeraceae bacterium EP7]
MISDADRFWKGVAKQLRRAKGFSIPTPEEAEAELDAAEEEPLTEEEIDAMVRAATSGEMGSYAPAPDISWLGDSSDETSDEELLVLNRNRGEENAEIDTLLGEQRREALGEHEQSEGDGTVADRPTSTGDGH